MNEGVVIRKPGERFILGGVESDRTNYKLCEPVTRGSWTNSMDLLVLLELCRSGRPPLFGDVRGSESCVGNPANFPSLVLPRF